MITETNVEEFCGRAIIEWRHSYGAKDYSACRKIAEQVISELKTVYREKSFGEISDFYNMIYVCLIYFKGLTDILTLVDYTADQHWPEDHEKTEAIWYGLWDAIERLEYVDSHYSDKSLCSALLEQLRRLESNFYDNFGRGLYASPEILIKKATCTICGENIKACSHITGVIYNGVPCRENAEDFTLHGVSLVNSPHDMRCRVWPWKMQKDGHFDVRIMNLNQLDNFIKE